MNFRVLIILFISFQCSTPQKDVEFELQNKEIYFAPIFIDEGGRIPWGIYDDYRTLQDKNNARNLITYKVKNNLPFKILFIPYTEEMVFLSKKALTYQYHCGLSYSIPNLYDKIDEFVSTGKMPKNQMEFENNYRKDSIAFAQDTIKYQSIYDRERFKDFMFINPNETILFEIPLDLPIVIESNKMANFGVDVQPLFKGVEYQFQLHYIQNKNELEKELPKRILDYLDKNNIKIIDLSLHSEIISLIGR